MAATRLTPSQQARGEAEGLCGREVVNRTLNEKPPDATHWSERLMAARAGIVPSSLNAPRNVFSMRGRVSSGENCSVLLFGITAPSNRPTDKTRLF
jgi:hypothetical protein